MVDTIQVEYTCVLLFDLLYETVFIVAFIVFIKI